MYFWKFIIWYWEASYLGIPAVNIGNRQEMKATKNVVNVVLSKDIVKAVLKQFNKRFKNNLYGMEKQEKNCTNLSTCDLDIVKKLNYIKIKFAKNLKNNSNLGIARL